MERLDEGTGYLIIKVDGKTYFKHRWIWQQANGEIPKGMIIHHKDGNKLNNEIENLEIMEEREHNRISQTAKPLK